MRVPLSLALTLLLALGVTPHGFAQESDTPADAAPSESPQDGAEAEDESEPEGDGGGAVGVAETIGKMMAVMFGDASPATLFGGDDYEDDDALNPLVGSPAPEFELESIDGETVRLADLRGKVVVLDFWATWCGPCVRAMPEVDAMAAEFDEDEVAVFGVNQGDSREEVNDFLARRDLFLPHLLDEDSSVGDSFGCESIPMTVVIDAEGVIQTVHTGFSPGLGETLGDEVVALLEGESLYDEQAVAAARAKVQKKLDGNRELMGPFAEERLVEAGFTPLDGEAYFSGPGSNGPRTVGEQAGVSLVLDYRSIGWFNGESDSPRVFCPIWPTSGGEVDEPSIDAFRLLAGETGTQLLLAGSTTDDDYDTDALLIGLFDADGENVWQHRVECVGDWGEVEIDAGDLDGDGVDEVVALFEQYGVFDATGVDRYCHVVAVYSLDGELLTRRWFDGQDGTGVYVVPGPESSRVMINLRGGAAFLRLEPASD